jgi:protein-S-isoprenylcysteine O-methyltransferase Ste14
MVVWPDGILNQSNSTLFVVVVWGIFWAYWFISALRTFSSTKRKRSSFPSRTLYFVPIIIILLIILRLPVIRSAVLSRFLPDNIALKIIGIILLIIGLGFAVWARVHLGRNWSANPVIKEDHKLIRTGPYNIVRHPIYSGIWLGVIGTAIVLEIIAGLLFMLLILVGFWLKIRGEEEILSEEFGQEYSQYKKEVKALIPYLI